MTTEGSPARTVLAPPTVGNLMRPATITVESDAHLAAAAYLMKRGGDTALVVTTEDENRRPIGVITESDITQAVADGADLEQIRIHDLGRNPLTVETDTTVDDAARLMLLHRIHHLPVVDHGRLAGIVDMSDVCRALLSSAGQTAA